MDELRLNLSTKFMKNIVAKLLAKAIYKKFGYRVDVELNTISVEVNNGKAYIHADVDAKIDNGELVKIVKSAGLD